MVKKKLLLALGAGWVLSSVAANPAHDQIYRLSESQRQGLFSKVLKTEDAACSVISDTFYRGLDAQGAAYWAVHCSKGKAYQVQISPNASGSTKIMDCAVLKMMGSECFRKFQ
jgi:hypothetical protein